jgi:sugar lactone lactonase YvrE
MAAPTQRFSLNLPRGIAVDRTGSLYVADTGNHRILRIDNPTLLPIVTVVAGTGRPGFSGDGGLATQAQLSFPSGVGVDLMGNLYIADTFNNRIRLVNTSGFIETIAGTDFSGCEGDNGLAINASLDGPLGVTVDLLGRVLIADTGCHRLRWIDRQGIITTEAGGGNPPDGVGDNRSARSGQLESPSDVFAGTGDLFFIADTNHHRVRQVDNGIITTIAGSAQRGFCGDGGLATRACLHFPRGVALGVALTRPALFIADTFNHRIRRVTLDGGITTVAGSGDIGPGRGGCSGETVSATLARLNEPWDVAGDLQGNLFIADTGCNRIRWVDTLGVIRTIIGP